MKLLLVILVTVIVGCLQDVDTEYVSTNGYAHSDTLTMETICYEGDMFSVNDGYYFIYYLKLKNNPSEWSVWSVKGGQKNLIQKNYSYTLGFGFMTETYNEHSVPNYYDYYIIQWNE